MRKLRGELMENGNNGFKIVLTADRTLMSEYNGGIFLGFSACVPQGLIPDKLYFSLFSLPTKNASDKTPLRVQSLQMKKTEKLAVSIEKL